MVEAHGQLTVGGTPQIYCVGGSQATIVGNATRVFTYNPATDTFATLPAGDDWPGAANNTLPGGFAVVANKLYIMGGFTIGADATAQTWQFDPTLGVGAKWLQRQDLPVARGYVPATSIGGIIYTGGGSMIVAATLTDAVESFKYDPAANTWTAIGGMIYTGGGSMIVAATLTDAVESFKFDPAANTWTAIANIPRATGETRAVTINNEMWVLGGGRVAPNPVSEVNIYNPASNTWTTGIPFATGRRNFPADTDGSRIWLAGGYDNGGLLINTMEIFSPGVCGTPTINRGVDQVSEPGSCKSFRPS